MVFNPTMGVSSDVSIITVCSVLGNVVVFLEGKAKGTTLAFFTINRNLAAVGLDDCFC